MSNIHFKRIATYCRFFLLLMLSGIIHANVPVNDKTKNEKININIGIYAPFTDKQAFIGRNMLSAMEMARDQLTSSHVQYSFHTLDKLSDKANPSSIIQKFIKAHQINVLITEGSVNGVLLASLATQNNIIHFSMASDPAIADGKNNFLIWSPAYEQASVLIKALKQKKIRQLGIITTNHPSDVVLTQSVVEQLQTSPITIAAYEQYKVGIKDFSGLINKIKNKKPDLYFIMANPDDIAAIQLAMKKAQIDKPITSIVDRVTPEVIKVFNNQWYIDTQEMNSKFIHQYQEANLENYPVTEAGFAFDVFKILDKSIIMAIKDNTLFSTQDLAKQIHALSGGEGVMGAFNLDKNGVFYTKSTIKSIENGQIRHA